MEENIQQALYAFSLVVPNENAIKRRHSGVPVYDFNLMVYLWTTSSPISSGREIIENQMKKLVTKTTNFLILISYEEKTVIGSKLNKIVLDGMVNLISGVSDFFLLDFYESRSRPNSWANKIVRKKKGKIIKETSDLITLISYWQKAYNDLEMRNLIQSRMEQELSLVDKDNITPNFLAAIEFIIEEELIILFQKKIKKLLKK